MTNLTNEIEVRFGKPLDEYEIMPFLDYISCKTNCLINSFGCIESQIFHTYEVQFNPRNNGSQPKMPIKEPPLRREHTIHGIISNIDENIKIFFELCKPQKGDANKYKRPYFCGLKFSVDSVLNSNGFSEKELEIIGSIKQHVPDYFLKGFDNVNNRCIAISKTNF